MKTRVSLKYLMNDCRYDFQSKIAKVKTTIEFCIFKLVFVPNFNSDNFDFLNQICLKTVFPV